MVNKIDSLKNGIVHGVGICLVVTLFLGGVYLVKGAWQSSNPTAGLGEPNSLYTDGNDTLTKEKWNALVEKVSNTTSNPQNSYISDWINVTTTSTAPGDGVFDGTSRNVYTINHNLNTTNVKVDVLFKKLDGTIRQAEGFDWRYYNSNRYGKGYVMKVVNSNTINIMVLSNPSYYCYLSHGAAHREAGQYKVKVSAF
ncbi:MAG: hypothetical protein V3575_03390 [Candidatus Absconditabacteria bacterium]